MFLRIKSLHNKYFSHLQEDRLCAQQGHLALVLPLMPLTLPAPASASSTLITSLIRMPWPEVASSGPALPHRARAASLLALSLAHTCASTRSPPLAGLHASRPGLRPVAPWIPRAPDASHQQQSRNSHRVAISLVVGSRRAQRLPEDSPCPWTRRLGRGDRPQLLGVASSPLGPARLQGCTPTPASSSSVPSRPLHHPRCEPWAACAAPASPQEAAATVGTAARAG